MPGCMLFHMMVMNSSLSVRDCSWKKPTACIISWMIIPFWMQPLPKERVCRPPVRPTYIVFL